MIRVDNDGNLDIDLPDNHKFLRVDVIDHLLQNTSKLNVKIEKGRRALIQAMKQADVLPCEEAILAAADLFACDIWVHHGMPAPVVYKSQNNEDRVIHLYCRAGVHFNPMRKLPKAEMKLKNKLVNMLVNQLFKSIV